MHPCIIFIGSCLVLLFVSFGAYGHLGDKLDFIKNGVYSHLLRCFRCWRLCRFFLVGGFTPLFVGIPPLPLLTITNKLEFAQFGAHMKKFWQFCFSPCGSTAGAAVVPLVASSGSAAPVPLYYRLDFGSCTFRVGFSSSCMAVRHGSSAYKR